MGGAPPFYYAKPTKAYYQLEFGNDVGYLPDGTPINKAGNMNNHEGMAGPDLHAPGSPLPPPLKGYMNDIGYLPDGTDMAIAGNLSNHRCSLPCKVVGRALLSTTCWPVRPHAKHIVQILGVLLAGRVWQSYVLDLTGGCSRLFETELRAIEELKK